MRSNETAVQFKKAMPDRYCLRCRKSSGRTKFIGSRCGCCQDKNLARIKLEKKGLPTDNWWV